VPTRTPKSTLAPGGPLVFCCGDCEQHRAMHLQRRRVGGRIIVDPAREDRRSGFSVALWADGKLKFHAHIQIGDETEFLKPWGGRASLRVLLGFSETEVTVSSLRRHREGRDADSSTPPPATQPTRRVSRLNWETIFVLGSSGMRSTCGASSYPCRAVLSTQKTQHRLRELRG
jgi:hypothetical protein